MSRSSRPDREGGRATPDVACPHCGATDVELESRAGSSLMSSQYYCNGCRTVFERVKWEDDDPAGWLDD